MIPDQTAESDLGDLVYVLILARQGHEEFRRRRDLAAHMHIAVSSLNDWEAGRDAPTLLNLIRWARVFGLRLAICDEQGDRPLLEMDVGLDRTWESSEARRVVATLGGIRGELCITQLELAERLDVTDATVLRWEHSRRHPRLLALLRWAGELGCVIQLRSMNSP